VDEPDQLAPSLGSLIYREVARNARAQAARLDEVLLIFRTVNPLGFLYGREGVSVEESSVVYS